MELKLLLVDDNRAVRETLGEFIEVVVGGYTISYAVGATQALEMVGNDPAIQIVLTDYNMPPGPNGIELARQLRDIRDDLVVLFRTGDLYEELEIQALAAGVRKAFAKDDLDGLAEELRVLQEQFCIVKSPS